MIQQFFTGALILFLGYLMLFKGGPKTLGKPTDIPVFADIPDEVWKAALETFKATK